MPNKNKIRDDKRRMDSKAFNIISGIHPSDVSYLLIWHRLYSSYYSSYSFSWLLLSPAPSLTFARSDCLEGKGKGRGGKIKKKPWANGNKIKNEKRSNVKKESTRDNKDAAMKREPPLALVSLRSSRFQAASSPVLSPLLKTRYREMRLMVYERKRKG